MHHLAVVNVGMYQCMNSLERSRTELGTESCQTDAGGVPSERLFLQGGTAVSHSLAPPAEMYL